MARKYMTKEVTKTTIKCNRIVYRDGIPNVDPLPDLVVIGNVSMERAQRIVTKTYGVKAIAGEVHVSTDIYEMEVEEFIKVAKMIITKEN